MNAAEAREVVADLRMVDAVVDITGRVTLDGVVVAESAGVHRRGVTVGGGAGSSAPRVLGEARWFETVLEWHARMPA